MLSMYEIEYQHKALSLNPSSAARTCLRRVFYWDKIMSNYSVSVIFDACKSVNVEADSPGDAIDKAYDEAGYASLCHQCAGEIEVGDAVRAIVFDGDGEQVGDDSWQEEKISKLTQQRDELLAALKDISKAYLRLLESGKDRIESLGGDCDSVDYMAAHDDSLISALSAIAKANGV